jgi:hypothetical protein
VRQLDVDTAGAALAQHGKCGIDGRTNVGVDAFADDRPRHRRYEGREDRRSTRVADRAAVRWTRWRRGASCPASTCSTQRRVLAVLANGPI